MTARKTVPSLAEFSSERQKTRGPMGPKGFDRDLRPEDLQQVKAAVLAGDVPATDITAWLKAKGYPATLSKVRRIVKMTLDEAEAGA